MADIYPASNPKCSCYPAKLQNTPWLRCISPFGSWCSRPLGRDLTTPLSPHLLLLTVPYPAQPPFLSCSCLSTSLPGFPIVL
ncbi:hypothetical protein DEO72_LG6g479 [Vigna unguiculata]|uniref:Uncharacterized protein n=1 Tax=Vigna unguiculata TaxID=3917 RepID=A0A4D6M4T3_VIGUN|nr:hypothetical protein DEO72_LG6g479 [Vigna unguiculata]